ncbi:cysteine hydrolase [Thermoleophilia bacterium SCSIO 60948]|nr:cysteine hydrolase [Thermoleophilia bacterium SCSIO 60948]
MSRLGVLVIDMLNPYDHEDAEPLAEHAKDRIEPISGLIDAALESDEATLVYVNDNHQDFTATSKDIGEAAMQGEHPELVEPLLPRKGSLFVQKVRHSAFYGSALDELLKVHEIDRLVLAGQVTEQCILYTALDAYMRGVPVSVASNAVVPIEDDLGDAALRMMESNMRAELVEASDALSGS